MTLPDQSSGSSSSAPDLARTVVANDVANDPALARPGKAETVAGPPLRIGPWLIGGGVILAVVLIGSGILATGLLGGTEPSPAPAPRLPSPSSVPRASQPGAMVGGLGEDSRNDPALVVCQLRGTVPGMVFHGTLSGPNIGSTNFSVSAAQPSHGVVPTSPTGGVFAIAFPGTGGRSGGGPLGPFTCTLTSVDVPAGLQLAPHQPSDWTLTVK